MGILPVIRSGMGILPMSHGLEARATSVRAGSYGNGDGNGRLDRKDVVRLARATSLAAEVKNPDFIAQAAHVFAHPAEGVAIEVARRADEADDARPAF